MIEINNIKKSYVNGENITHALNGITFNIKSGEFVAIMGPSGSGKSTLMHILGALDTPTSGTYRLDGHDVSELSDDELAKIRKEKIGFVFQSKEEEREKRAREALKNAGMTEDRFHHKSNQLSGGQIQRVAIARALVNNPSLILADEPTGNLDTHTGDIVLGTFERLNEDFGCTIILITHEKDVAEHADRIIHIRDGQIYDH